MLRETFKDHECKNDTFIKYNNFCDRPPLYFFLWFSANSDCPYKNFPAGLQDFQREVHQLSNGIPRSPRAGVIANL